MAKRKKKFRLGGKLLRVASENSHEKKVAGNSTPGMLRFFPPSFVSQNEKYSFKQIAIVSTHAAIQVNLF